MVWGKSHRAFPCNGKRPDCRPRLALPLAMHSPQPPTQPTPEPPEEKSPSLGERLAGWGREAPLDALPPKERAVRIRLRILTTGLLSLFILGQLAFLTMYPGFRYWEFIDNNLMLFAVISANIILMTAVFYLVLRNLFKLVYERKRPLGGVGLKTKLFIAFMALSLPSIGFHVVSAGFNAFLLETWTQGEYSLTLDNSWSLIQTYNQHADAALQDAGTYLQRSLPQNERDYAPAQDWVPVERPELLSGVVVVKTDGTPVRQWFADEEALQVWRAPSRDYLLAEEGYFWRTLYNGRRVRHLVLPLGNRPQALRVHLYTVETLAQTQQENFLTQRQRAIPFLNRDLLVLVLTSMGVVTLLIVFAAVWFSLYLARGFVVPVELLTHATESVTRGQLGYQIPAQRLGPLERDFRPLVRAFNAMSGQLFEQHSQLEATTADLAERNQLVELLLENIDTGILSLTPEGTVTAINRTGVRLLEPVSEFPVGLPYASLLPPGIAQLLDEMQAEMQGQPAEQARVERHLALTPDEQPVNVSATLLPLDNHHGNSEGFLVLFKDVSQIQRTQKAQAWREVARRIAHEIKNPLTPITLSAERLRRRLLGTLNDEALTKILDSSTATIVQEVSSLKRMVNEFSQFARMPECEPLPGRLEEVLEEVSRLFAHGLPEGVELKLNLPEDLPELLLDKAQLKRAFTNLVDNAVAAVQTQRATTPQEAGRIEIAAEYRKASRVVRVTVSDNGCGLPASVRSSVLEPYITTKEGGTGLGLTIVNQIVADHQGYLRFEDVLPHGTRFTVELPVNS